MAEDLMPLAFFSPDVHHSSRLAEMEPLEVVEADEVLQEGDSEARSLALRCRRSPIFSVLPSLQDRSAENMVNVNGNQGR
jgi:hypothetical protein